MTQNQTCPNPRMFRELLDGLLSESDQTQLAAHLDTCEQCRLKLDELTGELPIPPEVAQYPYQNSEPTETALFEAIKSMGNELPFDDQTRIEEPDENDFSIDFLDPSKQPDSMGRLGSYEISEVIGRGGMGIVLKGYDGKLRRVVAVKVLAPELASNPTARKRFLREARAAAAVNHPHVVTIHAVEETERLPYLVMELVDGLSLAQKIDDEGHLELKEILRIGMQVAEGLSAAHKQGLIHRDIKPSNILLENGVERVKITDFGLARAVDDIGITRTGEIAGTPQYMSPEQAQSEPVDQRADLFSLGSVLYAMCTGRSPFRADNMMAILRRVCDDTPRPIREINPDTPAWLVEIIDKLLAKNPADRFQSGQEIADLLSQHLADIQHPTSDPRRAVGVNPLVHEQQNHSKNQGVDTPRSPWGRLKTVALILVLLLTGVGLTEATGVTEFTATVIRIVTGEGTLLIEVDDPSVTVSIDGELIRITGAGVEELKLRPGRYNFSASKNGQPIKQELVTITRGGRQVVRVTLDRSVPDISLGEIDYKSIPEGAITEFRRFEGHPGPIFAVAFAPNGRFVVSCGLELTENFIGARVWDVDTGKMIRTLGSYGVRSVAISPDSRVVALGTFTGFICLVDPVTGVEQRRLIGHSRVARDVRFSSDGKRLLSGSADRSARLWDVQNGKELFRIDLDAKVGSVAFSPDGDKALVNTLRDGVYLWDFSQPETRQMISLQRHLDFQITEFSPDGRRTLAVDGNVIVLVDVETFREIYRYEADSTRVMQARFSPSGDSIISGNNDGTLRVWDVATGREIARVENTNHVTKSLDISPNGRYAVSGGGLYWKPGHELATDGDYALRVWRLPKSVWPEQDDPSNNAETVVTPAPEADTSGVKTEDHDQPAIAPKPEQSEKQ